MSTKWNGNCEHRAKGARRSRSRLLATARWSLLASVAALALAVLVVVPRDAATAITFNPTFEASVSDNWCGANADVTTEFNIPEGDANYDVKITFTPPEFGQGSGIPLGAHVGDLQELATLGLLNNPCDTSLLVSFGMLNASVNTSDTVPWEQCYLDLDGNTLPDCVDKYPDFLNTLFPGLTPTMRLFGVTAAAGSWITMNVVIFEPGTALYGVPFDPALGRPSVHVLNDPTGAPAPSAITDSCPPLTDVLTVFGMSKDNLDTIPDESGYVVSTNPATAGDYTFTTYTVSLRDADGDCLDNSLDTCPYDPNTGLDPDHDCLDNACDPDPDVANTDWDGDTYMNCGDNCPLVPNPDNADADADDIGDACDAYPGTPDGVFFTIYLEATVTIDCGPPANDDFANAFQMPPFGDERSTNGATLEPGEPQPCGHIGSTVWYKYVASENDTWEANTIGSDFNAVLAVYSGTSLGSLSLIECSDDQAYLQAVVAFNAVAGETYYFQVGGHGGETGLLQFHMDNGFCSPVIPGTYNGDVLLNGSQAPDGTAVCASIQGRECGCGIVEGGRYVLNCPQTLPVEVPCFHPGWVWFDADGVPCAPIVEWSCALNTVNLTCGPPATVRIGSGAAPFCSTAPVPLEVIDASPPGVAAVKADIYYDPNVADPVDYTKGPGWDMVECNLTYEDDGIAPDMVRCSALEATGMVGDALVADMTFHCIGETGDCSPLDVEIVKFTDADGNQMPVEEEDGEFCCFLRGDVNCDGVVDLIDALFVLQHDLGLRDCAYECPLPPGTLYCPAGDVNCDGDVDIVDALFILQCDLGLRDCNFVCP